MASESEEKTPALIDLHETSLPPHGSEALLAHLNGFEWLPRAMASLPDADIEHVRAAIDIPESEWESLRYHLVCNRLANRICEACGDKHDLTKLRLCSGCHLSWFCGSTCAQRQWKIHQLRCGKTDGPLDTGFQAIVMVGPRR